METQDIINKGIGNKEVNILKPAKVKIVSVNVKKKMNNGADMKVPLLEIFCKHPDKDELIVLTKVKTLKNDKVAVLTTWAQLDEDGKIAKSSTIALLLKHLGVQTIAEIISKEIETVPQSDKESYLCLKAY